MKLEDVPARYKKAYQRALAGRLSPRTAIRLFCVHCVGWVYDDAVTCTARSCPLYRYRPGTGRSARSVRGARSAPRQGTQTPAEVA